MALLSVEVEVFVDIVLRHLKTFSCPLGEVAGVQLGLVDRVLSVAVVGVGRQGVPGIRGEGKNWVATPVVDDGVPDRVHVCNSRVTDLWDVLVVTTCIASRVVSVNC